MTRVVFTYQGKTIVKEDSRDIFQVLIDLKKWGDNKKTNKSLKNI